MTEFVITLPIFVMIFGGMGMLYKYSNEGLIARMHTNQLLIDDLTADNDIPDFVPAAGAVFSIGSFTDIAVNGSGVLGIYYDSAMKANVAEALVPGQAIPNPASPPKTRIDDITQMPGLTAQESWTNMLLNDRATPTWRTNGMSDWAGMITSIASTLGVAPAIGAGIRYSPKQAEYTHEFEHPWTGTMSYNPGKLQLPAPTAATHRAAPVALARIAMNTVEPFKNCILVFKAGSPCTTSLSASTGQTNNVNEVSEQAEACGAQNDIYQSCLASCGAQGNSQEDCADNCENDEPPRSCRNLGTSLLGDLRQQCNDAPSGYCQQP